MNEISDSLVEKISKLLRLSHSDNEHEASLALIRAKKLAAENQIDLALIKIFDSKKSEIPIEKKDGIELGHRKSIAQKFVTNIIQKHFGCKVLYHGSRFQGMNLILIGTKENISISEYLNGYLNNTFLELWRKYKENNKCSLQVRNSYFSGLAEGLSEKLETEQKQVETEKLAAQSEEIKNQYALVVVSEKERLKKAVSEFYPKLGRAYSYNPHGYHSNVASDGRRDGAKISIRRSIGDGSNSNKISY